LGKHSEKRTKRKLRKAKDSRKRKKMGSPGTCNEENTAGRVEANLELEEVKG